MKRSSYLFLILLAILGCSQNGEPKTNPEYDQTWNMPTFRHKAMDYKYVDFGSIGFYDRSFREDTLVYPPIPGLIHMSRMAVTKNGNGANYATLAVRCPNEPKLLQWLTGRVQRYVTDWPIGYDLTKEDPVAEKEFDNAGKMVGYYMDKLGEDLKDEEGESFPTMTHQTGLLLADCWQRGDLYTFYESVWDNESHLNHEGYITVNAKTGKTLELKDFVAPKDYDELSTLVIRRLENEHGERLLDQDYGYAADGRDILNSLGGCALIREGFIIYFKPYILGSGGDGMYRAVIPYEELKGILL